MPNPPLPAAPMPAIQKIAAFSIVVALSVLALKLGAWWITGSIALFSESTESFVNLASAIAAFFAVRLAARPADPRAARATTDVGTDANTWQLTDYGSLQVGPRSRLNAFKRVEMYDINDLLLEIPDAPNAPEFDLNTVFQATGGSGGINTGALSAGFGGGPGALRGHSTQGVGSFADDMRKNQAEARRTGASNKASRSREEIELVFDRNKAAIYALYSRALRDNPQLQGKVVIQLTIAPTGEVTEAKVLSSELGDAELERKLVARIKMFRFEERDVELITTTKPIDFFPA